MIGGQNGGGRFIVTTVRGNQISLGLDRIMECCSGIWPGVCPSSCVGLQIQFWILIYYEEPKMTIFEVKLW